MTRRHITGESPAGRKHDRRRTPADASAAITIAALLPITIMVAWNADALTPDVVYQAGARGYDFVFGLAGLATAGLILMASIAFPSKGHVATTLAVLVSWFCIVWTFACSMQYDPEGSHNPYVRRMEPLPAQYEGLLAARSMPAVVEEIRRAATDGRIDRGEAYDILEGEVYLAAASEASRRKTEQTRRKLVEL